MKNNSKKTQLVSRLKAVWRLEQLLHTAEGALVFLRWGMLMFLVAVIIDWKIGVPTMGRIALLLVVLGLSLYKALKGGWQHVRRFNATHTALQVEEKQGGMESLLVTAVQFQNSSPRKGMSQAMCEKTCRQAEETADSVRSEKIVSFKLMKRPAYIALVVFALFAILGVTHGPLLKVGAGRLFIPWLSIPYPTRTHLELSNNDLVIQEGKPVHIAARIKDVIPKTAKIAIRTGKRKARVRTLPIVNNQCEYRKETAFRGFDYQILAGDARTPWQTVKVIPSPNIQQAQVLLDYPPYTRRSPETVEALTLTVPETTKIEWTLTLDRAVREGQVTFAGQAPVPLAISEDGLTVSFSLAATESRAYAFSWVEQEHGFSFASPSHYLQVAPDRPPRVELTSPDRNIYATIGRKMDLAFRGTDDHGVAESFVAYRVDKTEEEKVLFTPSQPINGREQQIDWDYRTALPEIAVGQTITFAVELTDNYPGDKGPHRTRSEARRMQFMSMEDYLAQIEKQKKRLLSQLRTIYREEREAHEAVLRLNPSDPIFIQTCQLEAVRQDLMRERLNKLAGRILVITEDLAANDVKDPLLTATLDRLRADILNIAAKHVSQAADALRTLSSDTVRTGGADSAQAQAAYKVNSSARELGLLVLQLGFEDAAEVMAREMHAAAETQAALRLRTITPGGDATELAEAQERLGSWLSRLFQASPKDKESTIDDALIEFTLTRLVKQLLNDGVNERLHNAAALLRDGEGEEAARLQSDMIAGLLKAEFRLRVGAEREALTKALAVFTSQTDQQRTLRLKLQALDPKVFEKRRVELAQAQGNLLSNLQLLLMPEIPAGRPGLLDAALPSPPPVADLLASADKALNQAAKHIENGDKQTAESEQLKAEESFSKLAAIVSRRIAAMTQVVRIERLTYGAQETGERLARFSERQLSLLEKTEDAAADETNADYLAGQQEALLNALEELQLEITDRNSKAPVPSENSFSLPVRIAEAMASMRKIIPLLKTNKPGEATVYQKAVVAGLAGAQELLVEHGKNIAPYAGMLAATRAALRPGPYVEEIEEEQCDMLTLTRNIQPDKMPSLALPQKNLIHAVNAILVALDPISHLVEIGTVMLFAKEDMDSAANALEIKDDVEALNAQEFIVETLHELRAKIDAVAPHFQYLLEVTEALHETVQEGILIREAQRRLREQAMTEKAPTALVKQQEELKARTAAYAAVMKKMTGLNLFATSLIQMAEAGTGLKSGDISTAGISMAQAEKSLKADTETILTLMRRLTLVLAAPEPGAEIPEKIAMLIKVLSMTARQKIMYRECYAAKPEKVSDYAPGLQAVSKACQPFIDQVKEHKLPVVEEIGKKDARVEEMSAEPVSSANLHLKLAAARDYLAKAAVNAKDSDQERTLANQEQAVDNLRWFVVEYALIYVNPPGPPPPLDPAVTEDFTEKEDLMSLFMPGAVSGKRPPDGKLEWEVLGKRDRAALNENFARELPLEYRAILKDYYERLAK